MGKYTKFVIEYPKIVLISIALITIVFCFGFKYLEFDNSIEVMMPKGDPEYLFYQKNKGIYGNTSRFAIFDVFCEKDNIWSKKVFNTINDFIVDIEEFKNFNKELEDKRLKKFDALSGGSIEYNRLIDEFGEDTPFQRTLRRKIADITGEVDVLNASDLRNVRRGLLKTYDIKKAQQIDQIMSAFTSQDISGENDTLQFKDLLERDKHDKRILPETKKDFDRLKKSLLKFPAYEKTLFAKDPKTGKITDLAVVIKLDTSLNHQPLSTEFWDIANSYKDITIISQGGPIMNMIINDFMKEDMKVFCPLILLVVIIIFYLNFKSMRGVILPVSTIVLTTIWLFGFMGYAGIKITIMGVGLPVLLMAIGSSYSIHIMNQYYIDFDMITEKGRHEGLKQAMGHISITVLLAGLTTFIGFMTITTNIVTAIREWAFLASMGAIISVVISISIIPACSVLLPHRRPGIMLRKDRTVKTTIVDRLISIMKVLTLKHHRATLAILGVVLLIALVGVFQLRVETTPFAYFDEDSYIRKSEKIIGNKFGGIFPINMIIDSGEVDGVMKPEILRKVDELCKWLITEENIELNLGRADSLVDFIKSMHMVMNNDNIAYYDIPKTNEEVMDYFELLAGDDENSDGRVDIMESFVDPEFRNFHIMSLMYSRHHDLITVSDIENILTRVSAHLKKEFPNNNTRMAGEAPIFLILAHYVIKGQLLSLFLCLIVVGIIVVLLFKNVKVGFVALIPMSTAVLINFGIMGWSGIDLDMATAMIAAITVGIGVDDTIHFFNTYRHMMAQGYSIDESIEGTLNVAGKAIVYTSLALIFGFSVMLFSNFVPNAYFGLLVALTMISTTIGALLILPAAIKATGISLDESKTESVIWKYLYIGKLFGVEQEN